MKRILFLPCVLFFLLVSSCSKNNDTLIYHRFKDRTWHRFDILHFEIPVRASENNYDVFLFVRHTPDYEFDDLDFNMIMTTPSGEERINEYHMNITRKDGGFVGQCDKDSCEVNIPLKKQLKLTKGNLILEIENLVPRMEVRELLCIGIRLHPS